MTSSRYPQITDELLSAYIDNQVTDAERALIETALAEDPRLVWQLESLRYTVDLLHTLPQFALPRSFVLSDAQLVDGAVSIPTLTEPPRVRAATARKTQQPTPDPGGFWLAWRNFWQVGNLFLRNAAAASLALFLVVSAGGALLQAPLRPQSASKPTLLSVTPAAVQQPITAISAPGTDDRQALDIDQATTTQPTAGAETGSGAAGAQEKQAAEQAASSIDNNSQSTEVVLSPVADSDQPTDSTQPVPQPDAPAQVAATQVAFGQGMGGANPQDGPRGSGLASASGDGPNNLDLAPPKPQAQPSPLQVAVAEASVGSADSFSMARSVVVTDLVATAAATSADTISATVVISASAVVSSLQPSGISAHVSPSLASETEVLSGSLLYSTTQAEAAIPPTYESAAAGNEPRVDRNAATLVRIFQFASALAAFLLGVFWWRSRSTSPETR